MTEPIVPDPLADGIVSGSVDPSTLPAELRGVAEVVAAAHQPPTEGELAGMASAVSAFRATVTSTAPAVAPEPPRSVVTMFSTRIPKRAAVIVAATVLMAGTAAAAAGGAIPAPFAGAGESQLIEPLPGEETSTTETTVDPGDTTTTTESGDTTTTESGDTTTTESGDTTTTTDDPAATESTYPGRDYGHCTAWGVGAPKSTDIPGFRSLGESAEAAGLTVEEYCELVLAAKHGDATDDADDDTDASTSTVDDADTTRTNGNGKGNGNGNGRGNGKGKP